MARPYDRDFFAGQAASSLASAEVVLPLVFDRLAPRSVLDFGCGVGSWLAAARALGADDILGIDGDYVAADQLMIPPEAFLACDLAATLPDLDRRFDLVMTLEVMEHLPEARAAPSVAWFCDHGDRVLFSAAIPLQGGHNHVNERWPSWWAALFAGHGLLPYDIVRPQIWSDGRVRSWYRQNVVLFMRPAAAGDLAPTPTGFLDLVHPATFVTKVEAYRRRSIEGRVKRLGRRLGLR